MSKTPKDIYDETDHSFSQFVARLGEENFVITKYREPTTEEYQWGAPDAGQFTPVVSQLEMDDKLKYRGGKGRVREVGPWREYTRTLDDREILFTLEGVLEHNPSSEFNAKELLRLIKDIREGRGTNL